MEIILKQVESKEIETTETESKELELEKQYVTEKNYNKLDNKPSINGIILIGDKTLEELGIKIGSDINILKEFDIEYTYEDNEVYNANAIHQLMEIFGYEIMNIQENFDNKQDKSDILTGFDIDPAEPFSDTQVYNANAINAMLTEIFVPMIMDIGTAIEEQNQVISALEQRVTALENK